MPSARKPRLALGMEMMTVVRRDRADRAALLIGLDVDVPFHGAGEGRVEKLIGERGTDAVDLGKDHGIRVRPEADADRIADLYLGGFLLREADARLQLVGPDDPAQFEAGRDIVADDTAKRSVMDDDAIDGSAKRQVTDALFKRVNLLGVGADGGVGGLQLRRMIQRGGAVGFQFRLIETALRLLEQILKRGILKREDDIVGFDGIACVVVNADDVAGRLDKDAFTFLAEDHEGFADRVLPLHHGDR